ncbi:hypothetical protein BDW60DRAFT_30592 [Aspergillus nidulans var. acristatus]
MPTLNRVDVKSYVRHVGPVACVRPESEVRALGSAPAPLGQIPSQGLTVLWHPLLAKRSKLGSLGSCLPTRSAGRPGTGLSEELEQNSNYTDTDPRYQFYLRRSLKHLSINCGIPSPVGRRPAAGRVKRQRIPCGNETPDAITNFPR